MEGRSAYGERVLLFITSGLFLARAAVLASRVSGHIGGRFPRHPQVTRRGETQAYHTAERKGKKKKKHAGRHQRGLLQLVALFTQALNQRRIIAEGNTSSQTAAEGAYI